MFSYSQPSIIGRAIRYVGETNTENATNMGIELIGAAAVIYIGIAVSTIHP